LETDEKKPGRVQRIARGVRAPLVITVVILIVVGGLYYAYYNKQVDYYTGRNLRLLSMLTAQIEGRAQLFEGFVSAHQRDETQKSPGIEFSECPPAIAVPPSSPQPDSRVVQRNVEERGRGWGVVFEAKSTSSASRETCGSADLDAFLHPVFARKTSSAFDALLVAKADGTVLYGIRPPSESSALLRHEEEWIDEEEEPPDAVSIDDVDHPVLKKEEIATAFERKTSADSTGAVRGAVADRESGSVVMLTDLKALRKQKSWRGEAEPWKIDDALRSSTANFDVELGGAHYVLFTQPYSFASSRASLDHRRQDWIVCGLVSSSRFRYDVSAVSTTKILIAVAIVLLAVCCWPFLRISLIHQSQELRITDVILIVICTIVGAAVLTLAVLDAFAYRAISRIADEQLRKFSEQVDHDFGTDVVRAMNVLDAAERATLEAAKNPTSPPRTAPLPKELLVEAAVRTYPYIDSVSWIDDTGQQRVRYSRTDSPVSNVASRKYFQLALKARASIVNGRPYVLEWVRSKATGEVRAVLAKHTDNGPFPVISLATELIDISHEIGRAHV